MSRPGLKPYENVPPMRAALFEGDPFDQQRVDYVMQRWTGQDEALRRRDRQIEESIRMLAGQQWTQWNPWLQKFMDVTEWMTDDERRWRQRPVINRLLYWYIITHSRLTENPPIITFQPSNPDRLSAMLAEVSDIVYKSQWRSNGMNEVVDRLIAWMIPSGRAYLQSVFDPQAGDFERWIGQAMLPVVGPAGEQMLHPETLEPMEAYAEQAPYGADGSPLAHYQLHPETMQPELVTDGEPHGMREGGIRVDVLAALQVRGEWGPKPWHQKRWHIVRAFLSPEEIWELYNVDVPAENVSVSLATSDPGFLQRVFFGSGYFGAASNKPGVEYNTAPAAEGFVETFALWEEPCNYPGMEDTPDSPGGRFIVTTRSKCLRDGVRPFRFRYTSGIRCFDFINVPGRPSGTSPQEMLNPLQRTYNRFNASVMENANLIANPIGIIDQASGLGQVQMTNKPGERFVVNKRPGVDAFEYVQPPSLGRDVYQALANLRSEMQDLGHIAGAEGTPPTEDPSGKLVKELRYNSDRFLGSTSRREVEEMGRMGEDWLAILEVVWDVQKIVTYSGDDTVTRTLTVFPEMFKRGMVHAFADIESMLPESRSERQQRVFQMWQAGAFGLPQDPGAIRKFLELSRFPHMGRTAWPGGIHIVTAQQENGRLIQGTSFQEVQVLEWYDDQVHLQVHEEFMAAPEFLKLPPEVQRNFVMHRLTHQQALNVKLIKQAFQQSQLQSVAMAAAGAGAGGGGGGGNGGGAPPGKGAPPPQGGPAASGAAEVPQGGV